MIYIKPLFNFDFALRCSLIAIPMLYFIYRLTINRILDQLAWAELSSAHLRISMSGYLAACALGAYTLVAALNSFASPRTDVEYISQVVGSSVYSTPRDRTYHLLVENPIDKDCCLIPPQNIRIKKGSRSQLKLNYGTPIRLIVNEGLFGLHVLRSAHIDNSDENISAEDDARAREAMTWNPPPPQTETRRFKTERWSENRRKSKEPIVNGKIHGIGEYWFANGQLYGRIPYLEGEKHGRFTLYRENGNVDQELSYKNGKLHGICRWFTPEGGLLQEALYVDGEHVQFPK